MKILYIVNIFFSDKIVELCPKWWMIQDEDFSIIWYDNVRWILISKHSIMENWGILYMYHSLVVGKIKEFICDNAFISY